MAVRHVPIRTCVFCRSKKEKPELLRLVLDSEQKVILDHDQRLPGRGAYFCRNCFHEVRWDKRLQRAFRNRAKGLGTDLECLQ